ncbi:MAG: acyl-CoA thioesterase [Hyphomicrobiales bacterium]|nr:acyl-CoA thioesterase [Hyphomicrobiales bacterium]
MPGKLDVRIAWGDCDADGGVHHPRCFYWMDSTFQALMLAFDLGHRDLVERYGAHIPIVEAGVELLTPATYDETLTVEVQVARWGTRSFRIDYAGWRGSDPIFKGHETRVWAVIADDGSIRTGMIPPEFKTAVQSGGL